MDWGLLHWVPGKPGNFGLRPVLLQPGHWRSRFFFLKVCSYMAHRAVEKYYIGSFWSYLWGQQRWKGARGFWPFVLSIFCSSFILRKVCLVPQVSTTAHRLLLCHRPLTFRTGWFDVDGCLERSKNSVVAQKKPPQNEGFQPPTEVSR